MGREDPTGGLDLVEERVGLKLVYKNSISKTMSYPYSSDLLVSVQQPCPPTLKTLDLGEEGGHGSSLDKAQQSVSQPILSGDKEVN